MPELPAERQWHTYVESNVRARLDHLTNQGPHTGDAGADRYAQAALRKAVDSSDELDTLLSGNDPYFGRTDHADGYAIYIGRTRIRDLLDNRPDSHTNVVDDVVTNWQAKAASAFYTARPGNPQGLTRRRRYQFDETTLTRYTDEHLAAPRTPTPARPMPVDPGPTPQPRLRPESLVSDQDHAPGVELTGTDALLADLACARDHHMRDIVTTIQAEQYQLMETTAHGLLTVQGAPGTGKTAVALHRLSLLAYREPTLRKTGLALIGPSARFIEYVSQVLPTLGDHEIRHAAINDLTDHTATRDEPDPATRRLKGDPRMARLLRAAVDNLLNVPDVPLTITLAGTELTYSRADALQTIRDLRAEPLTHKARLTRVKATIASALAQQYTDGVGGPSRLRNAPITDPGAAVSTHPDTSAYAQAIAPPATAPQLLHQLWNSSADLLAAARGVLTDHEVAEIWTSNDAHGSPRPERRSRRTITHEWTDADLPLLDELDSLLDGGPERTGHVAVDEAQDLTPMQLRMIGRRLNPGAGATLLGDLAQATGPWTHQTWTDLIAHLNHPGTHTAAELTHGYRVPRQIINIANQVLPHTATTVPTAQAVRDLPGSVQLLAVPTGDDATDTAIAAALQAAATGRTTALIACPNTANRFTPEQRHLFATNNIQAFTPADIKGLEFDHVVLLEPGAFPGSYDDEAQGARALYVALTRATTSLTITHRLPLPYGITIDPIATTGARL